MLGVRTNEGTPTPASPSRPTVTLGRTSLDSSTRLPTENGGIGLGRPPLDVHRGASFDSRTRPALTRSSTSPERTETTTEADSSPSPDMPFEEYRPSLDSVSTTKPSFDGIIINRPNSASHWDGHRNTPSLRVVDMTVRDRASPVPRIPNPPNARMRKRSMSVQERFDGRGRVATNDVGAGLVRPGSSLSAYAGRASRAGGAALGLDSGNESDNGSSGPKMEWLGPRTAKAFRAAGLLDFEREKERDRGRQ